MADYSERPRLQFRWARLGINTESLRLMNKGPGLPLQSFKFEHWRKKRKDNEVSRHQLLTLVLIFFVSWRHSKLLVCKVPDILFGYRLGESDWNLDPPERSGNAASNNDLVSKNMSI